MTLSDSDSDKPSNKGESEDVAEIDTIIFFKLLLKLLRTEAKL
jgi:hypothetical protein